LRIFRPSLSGKNFDFEKKIFFAFFFEFVSEKKNTLKIFLLLFWTKIFLFQKR